MNQEVVNEAEPKVGDIIYRNGIRYKVINRGKNKTMRMCAIDDCECSSRNGYEYHCIRHYNELHGLVPEIIYKNGLKYRKTKSGAIKLACIVDECMQHIQSNHTYYCMKHYLELGVNDNERSEAIKQTKIKIQTENENKEKEYKEFLEKNYKIIDTIKIYFVDGKKYRIRETDNLMIQACMFDDCNRYILRNTNYCRSHLKYSDKNHIETLKTVFSDKEMCMTKIENINNIKIYYKDDKKYRTNKQKEFIPACSFIGCNKFAKADNYCFGHENGTASNSPDKLEKRKLALENQKITAINNTKIGDETEQWLCDIIQTLVSINSVKRIGYIRSELDVIYKVNNEDKYRGVQVKTLQYSKRSNVYSISSHTEYSDDTLIVGISKKRDKFVLYFSEELQNMGIRFSFGKRKTKYSQYMFTDLSRFLIKLEELLPKSSFYDINKLQRDVKTEHESMERLKNKCIDNELTFEYFETHASRIDCIINNYNVQCKASSRKSHNIISFSINTYAGKINGKKISRPYSDIDGIDFFIMEMLNYKGDFYIIPIKEMINRGYIKTAECNGKKSIGLPKPGYTEDHWAKKYLNNFDQLTG